MIVNRFAGLMGFHSKWKVGSTFYYTFETIDMDEADAQDFLE